MLIPFPGILGNLMCVFAFQIHHPDFIIASFVRDKGNQIIFGRPGWVILISRSCAHLKIAPPILWQIGTEFPDISLIRAIPVFADIDLGLAIR